MSREDEIIGGLRGSAEDGSYLRVFIYGTLKKNEPNGCELQSRNAVFIGHGITVDKWPLIVSTSANIPFILNKKDYGKQITGELYLIDQSTKQFLDEFEEVDKGFYSCHTIQVRQLDTDALLDVHVYMLDKFASDLLNENTVLLDAYTSRNPHYPEYNRDLDFGESVEYFLNQVRPKSN